jgi:hypothetical protein
MALRSNPNTGTFVVAVTLAFDAGAAAMSASEMNPVDPNTGLATPVEQDTPVVELYPEVDVQPAGKVTTGFTTPVEQDAPVVELYPAVDVQPAGKVVVAQDAPVVGLYPEVDVQPTGGVTTGAVLHVNNNEFNFALVNGPT